MRTAGALTVGLVVAIAASGASRASNSPLVEADIPTRGCAISGMLGDQPPPSLSPTIKMFVPAGEASHLTYFRSAWPKGVLGPRDWQCAARSGSGGIALTVGPPGTDFDSDKPAVGPMIVLRLIEGGTSGRFAAAAVLARAFPAFWTFAKGVAAEHLDEGQIVFHPFPSDELTRVSDRAVIFRTPGGQAGLGTSGELERGPAPIGGFASVAGPTNSPQVTVLAVRLPPGEEKLSSLIVAAGLEASVGATSLKP